MNFYDVLNIKPTATDKEIKKAYRVLAKKYHPDTYDGNKEFAEGKMQEINIAYETLSDAKLRKDYDNKLGLTNEPINETKTKKSSYSSDVHYSNHYNKDGVNYEVRYRPNNSKIHYDSYGYAESNYYTSNPEEVNYKKRYSNLGKSKLKEILTGQNLIYVIIGSLLIILVLSITIYKAVESINEFITSTQAISQKINSSKEETKKKSEESANELKENVYPAIDNMVENIKKKEQEIIDEYNSIRENYDQKELLNELGITDSKEQQEVLDFIKQLQSKN